MANKKSDAIKRDQLQSMRAKLEARKTSLFAQSEQIDDERAEAEIDREIENITNQINLVCRAQCELSVHDVKNAWFIGVVSGLGEGLHNITRKQAACFARYCESNENTWITNEMHCRCNGYFVTLNAPMLYISIRPLTTVPA